MTLPFEPCTFQEARQWAKQRQEILFKLQEAKDE
jgi:hypothetical protein